MFIKLRHFFLQEKTIVGLLYVALFLFCLYPYGDYDWGWHFKYGEYFIKTGHIMRSDVWSWSMPGYQWINHEWLFDVLVYVLTSSVGFTGLSIAGALIVTFAFYLSLKDLKLHYVWKGILAFFYAYLLEIIVFQGLRSQSVGILMLAVLGYLLRLSQKQKIVFILLPLFFLIFANLHGYSVFGILIFGIAVFQSFMHSFEKEGRRIAFTLQNQFLYTLASFTVSVVFTLINPFGIGIYKEVFHHFNNELLSLVLEWTPVPYWTLINFVIILYSGVLTFFIARKSWGKRFYEIDYYQIGIFLLLFYLSYTARRYVPVFVVSTLPFYASYLSQLRIKLDSYKSTILIASVACVIAIEIGVVNRVLTKSLFHYGYKEYCIYGSTCSEELVQYLYAHPPQGRGLNFYDWGGYLIGRGVNMKVFVDGRMHLWETPKGYKPMLDYAAIYYGGRAEVFAEYNFNWVLVPANSNMAEVLRRGLAGPYKKMYEDSKAVYYVKTK